MAFPTVSLIDDFNRANEGPPPSASWTDPADAASLKVASNLCIHNDVTLYSEAYHNTIWLADQEVEVKIAALQNDNNALGGVHFRAQDVTESSDKYNVDPAHVSGAGNDLFRFWKKVGGTWTQLGADVALGAEWVAGDTFGARVVGSTIEGFRNGVSLGTRTDAAITAAGRSGLVLNGNVGSPAYDDIKAGSFTPTTEPTLLAEATARACVFQRAIPPLW